MLCGGWPPLIPRLALLLEELHQGRSRQFEYVEVAFWIFLKCRGYLPLDLLPLLVDLLSSSSMHLDRRADRLETVGSGTRCQAVGTAICVAHEYIMRSISF